MRVIRSFNDVQIALRDIETAVNEFRGRQWNLNQRRITNVHPSQDEYDVVVRKELFGPTVEKGDKPLTPASTGRGSADYDTPVFGLGINQNIITGINVCPPFISAFAGTITKCYAIAGTPPVGSDIIIDINLHHDGTSVSIFSAPIHIVDGEDELQLFTSFANSGISEGDYLTLDVNQIGSTTAGSMLVLKLKIKRA